jgi:hypothetical protein
MLVFEELKKRNIPWEIFIVSSHIKFNITSTSQSNIQIPFPSTSIGLAGSSKKRKGMAPTQDQDIIKEV